MNSINDLNVWIVKGEVEMSQNPIFYSIEDRKSHRPSNPGQLCNFNFRSFFFLHKEKLVFMIPFSILKRSIIIPMLQVGRLHLKLCHCQNI